MTEEIRAIAAKIPVLSGYDGPIERLGGLTNRVFRLGEHCLRLPGAGTEEFINRAHEAVAAREAARAEVSPAVLYADQATGLMVTRYVDGATTMSPDGFRSRHGSPARAGQALRKLHSAGLKFPFRFDLFAMIDDYLRILGPKDIALPPRYDDALRQATAVRKALAAHPVALVACHCDPLCENFLDTGSRMWIVDWEYSGMNDPMWDLGDLSVEGQFDDAQDAELLAAYFGSVPSRFDHGRMVIYKAMCDLLWTLWGLIQLANANPADDFASYATTRFNRCMVLTASEDFARHLRAVDH